MFFQSYESNFSARVFPAHKNKTNSNDLYSTRTRKRRVSVDFLRILVLIPSMIKCKDRTCAQIFRDVSVKCYLLKSPAKECEPFDKEYVVFMKV